jgi:hypothetical protein
VSSGAATKSATADRGVAVRDPGLNRLLPYHVEGWSVVRGRFAYRTGHDPLRPFAYDEKLHSRCTIPMGNGTVVAHGDTDQVFGVH